MADNSKTFQELLIEQRTTNERLSALNSDNKTIGQLLKELKDETAKPDSVSENIAGALPEILSDKSLQQKRIKYDEEEGITNVDDEIRGLNDSILLGFDTLVEIFEDQVSIAKSALIYEKQKDIRQKREKLSETSDGEIIANKLDEIEKNKELDEIGKGGTSFFGGLSGALAGVSLGGLIKGIGKGILKGGLYGIIGAVIGDELAHRIDSPFFKEAFSKAIPAGAIGLAFAGLPGALLGVASTGLFGLYEYIAGETDSISTYDFGSAVLGTAGAAYLGGPKLKKALEKSKYGPIKTLGAALRFTPFLVATGIAIALGAGLRFIANRMDEYEKEVINRASKITSDENLGETLAEGKQAGAIVGKLTKAGSKESETIRKSTELIVDEFSKEQQLDMESIASATQTALALLKIEPTQMDEILKDEGKRKDIFETINNLTFLASKEQLENSESLLKDLLILQDTITQTIDGNNDILESSGKLNRQKIEQEDIISQMEKELQEKMKEYNIEKITKTGRFGGSEEMKELRSMVSDINEQKDILKTITDELDVLKIGELGAGTSLQDIINLLGPDVVDKLIENQKLVSTGDNPLQDSLALVKESVDKLTETMENQNKPSVSQNIFSGGTRTNLYQKNNDVVLNKSNKSNDTTFNAVSTSNY